MIRKLDAESVSIHQRRFLALFSSQANFLIRSFLTPVMSLNLSPEIPSRCLTSLNLFPSSLREVDRRLRSLEEEEVIDQSSSATTNDTGGPGFGPPCLFPHTWLVPNSPSDQTRGKIFGWVGLWTSVVAKGGSEDESNETNNQCVHTSARRGVGVVTNGQDGTSLDCSGRKVGEECFGRLYECIGKSEKGSPGAFASGCQFGVEVHDCIEVYPVGNGDTGDGAGNLGNDIVQAVAQGEAAEYGEKD